MPDHLPAIARQREKKVFSIHEDWAVVLLGFTIIFIFIGGAIVPAPSYNWDGIDAFKSNFFSEANLFSMLTQFSAAFIIALAGAFILNRSVKSMAAIFPFLYAISVIALLLSGNKTIKTLHLEAVIFSLSIGLCLGNLIRLPNWIKESLSAEFFVKIGLVLLGTNIIFGDILKAGGLGLIQALVVVVSVWYFAFWICKKIKLDEELSLMIASAVSICGVSAAIATAGAIKGDAKKLSYVISLVLVTAIPMMILMPYLAAYMELSPAVTGAWLGGTIDTTGAVVAAGSISGPEALNVSTIVKFSQNVLLGLAAFAISVYWAYAQRKGDSNSFEKPSLKMLWERFPKFVIGFMAASLLFSFLIDSGTIQKTKEGLKSMQTLWFVLAFTSIGLETRFRDLFNSANRKPLYAFLIAQGFNILVTLGVAYVLFNA